MTPKPQPFSDGSVRPPRQRSIPGVFDQDTTEHDLWAFDDDPDAPPVPEAARLGMPPRTSGTDLPPPRERQADKSPATGNTRAAGDKQGQLNLNMPQVESEPAGSLAGAGQPQSEDVFDDLESWGNAPDELEIDELPADFIPVPPEAANPPEPVAAAETPPQSMPVTEPTAEREAEASAAGQDEFSPVVRDGAEPVSLRPRFKVSAVERIWLILLLVMLLAGGGVIFVFSLNQLPTGTQRAKAHDFPIKGSLLTIDSATSYWRKPMVDGPAQDTFRRGTQLLPVLELKVSGGPAIIRVLFRNEDRLVIGDAVTRSVRDGGILKIPATAGFDDFGMHAAYRAGESKPWTVEVLEAPADEAAGPAFTRLFEMNIATDRR